MGKTAVFVLSCLHQLEAKEDSVGALVLCHTRELAYQICNEFERFSRYLPDIKTKVPAAPNRAAHVQPAPPTRRARLISAPTPL